LGEWLAELLQRLPEIILVDTLESSGPLACILHGDYCINNILFKYDSIRVKGTNIPVSLKMLDFQTSRIGHPLSDVLYFFYSSTKPETREEDMLVLLRHYFNTLTADLRLLSVSLDDYTWQDFLSDYKKRSLMWMFMGVMVLSGVLNKKSVSNLQDLDAEEKLKGPKPGE
jgi:aminoglycoside phosphotransferase (APT) family kinase protein